ncbi:hypothetical protein QTP88_005438 [Uroleucon formosanum]
MKKKNYLSNSISDTKVFSLEKFSINSVLLESGCPLLQNDISLRNSFNYDNDVIINNVYQTGIKEKCIWNDLNSFWATENYSFDIMHDVLEGYFTVEISNDRIETFNYGPIDIRNRPTLISTENLKYRVIKMSAAESLCFTRYLGLIIGDLVPINSEFWALYIILKKIVDIIFQKFLSSVENVYTIPIQLGRVVTFNFVMLDTYNTRINFLNKKLNFHIDNITFASWVNIKDTSYNCKNMCVMIDANQVNTMMPSFGLIIAIFMTDEKRPFTICEMYQTIYFDEHYQAFNVIKTNNLVCISLEQLGSIYPTRAVNIPGLKFIPIK